MSSEKSQLSEKAGTASSQSCFGSQPDRQTDRQQSGPKGASRAVKFLSLSLSLSPIYLHNQNVASSRFNGPTRLTICAFYHPMELNKLTNKSRLAGKADGFNTIRLFGDRVTITASPVKLSSLLKFNSKPPLSSDSPSRLISASGSCRLRNFELVHTAPNLSVLGGSLCVGVRAGSCAREKQL